MDVSVIIVNYKTLQLLVQAIDSILDKTEDIVYEIIVVDNHSQDDSERVVHERYGNRVTYLLLAENVGFGRANNEGLRIARGRNILFLNPDTILVNNAVRILSDYLDSHPDTGAVGGNLYTADMQPNVSFNRVRPSISTKRIRQRTVCYPDCASAETDCSTIRNIRLKSVSSQAPT